MVSPQTTSNPPTAKQKVGEWLLQLSDSPFFTLIQKASNDRNVDLTTYHSLDTIPLHRRQTFAGLYQLHKKLGSGKHGTVWLVGGKTGDRKLTIKIYHDYKRRIHSFYSEVDLY